MKNKKILLGVTGSIAAYKSAFLTRELIKLGAEVRVIMTPSATEFITQMTFSNLTKHPVSVDMFDETAQQGGAWHIHLANWCDAMLIAPATASTIGKLANGICDTALVTVATALPKEKDIIVAPAMDTEMWLHPATQRNIDILKSYGCQIIPPAEGELSSGLSGPGRLPEVHDIIIQLMKIINIDEQEIEIEEKVNRDADDILINTLDDAISKDEWSADMELTKLKNEIAGKDDRYLTGKKVLITAGPTHEKIDDVRYISNHSSGKMGFALAESARFLGAEVTLIAGPVSLETPEGVIRMDVRTAGEMHEAVMSQYDNADIIIMAAAVADFTLQRSLKGKIKKDSKEEGLDLKLIPTKDILSELGNIRKEGQILVGFALESENEIEYGRQKLQKKNCDIIVVNSANKPKSGFGGDHNTITILTKDNEPNAFPPMTKKECSLAVFNSISNILRQNVQKSD